MLRTPSSKVMGCDLIPPILYKEAADLIAEPLAHIYSLSVSQQRFPKQWKVSHVCPIPKSSPLDVNKLRPIALLPLPSKILEKLVLRSVHSHFIDRLEMDQFGSRPKSSTTCAIISMMHCVLANLESSNTSGVQLITYDYSKAFDVLSHGLIMKRLKEENFPSQFIFWIEDNLANRFQAVRIGSAVSTQLKVTSGVPQGSVLGPLLFCLVVAGLKTSSNNAHLIKYVDDTTLCVPLFKESPNDHVTNEHLNILKWSSDNGFDINLEKCKSICFHKSKSGRAVQLPGVSAVNRIKFLGVTINDKLNWKCHIEEICSLASKRVYGLRVLKKINVSTENLVLVYNAIIRSVLEYASPSLGDLPSLLSKKLEKVQRRCHRFICGLNPGSECECGMFEPLNSRRNTAVLKLFKKATDNDHVLHSILPNRSTRSCRFTQPPCSTTRFRSSFVPHATFISNSLSLT